MELIKEDEWKKLIDSLKTDFDSLETNKERAKRKLKDALINAVKSRATEKFGIMFSGGIDSTLISLIAKQLNCNFTCYSIGLENSQDIEWAQKVADSLKLKLKFKILSLEELEIVVKEVTNILNEPDVMKVSVGAVVYAAEKMANIENIHNIFSGLGSEELFAGYQRHDEALKHGFEAVHKECIAGLKNMGQRDLTRDSIISKVNGIDLKVPFLDKEVIRIAMSIHPMHKIDKATDKIIIREIAEEMSLPKEFAWRKKKAAQYGSKFLQGIDKLARKNGFELKKDYLKSLI